MAVRADQRGGHFHAARGRTRARRGYHHISTDEVYGDLELDDPGRFTETTPYNPSSPYSATKAGSDLLVRAWARSFGVRATSATAPTTTAPTSTSRSSSRARSPTCSAASAPGCTAPGERPRLDPRRRSQRRRAARSWRGGVGETYLIGADGERSNQRSFRLLLELFGRPRTTSTRHRPRRPRPALRDRLHASCAPNSVGPRTRISAGPGRDGRVVPRPRVPAAAPKGRDGAQVRRGRPVTGAGAPGDLGVEPTDNPRPAGAAPCRSTATTAAGSRRGGSGRR